MTTLHVREGALRARGRPVLLGRRPPGRGRLPAHAAGSACSSTRRSPCSLSGDREIAASGDGLLLRGVVADGDLPVIKMDAPPAGDRVGNAQHAHRAGDRRRRARPPPPPDRPAVDRPAGDDARARRRARPDLRRRVRSTPQVARRDPRAGRSERGRSDLPGRPRYPSAWRPEGSARCPSRPPSRRALRLLNPFPRPTLNRRVRMRHLSTRSRDFGDLQRLLPRFEVFDIGKEMRLTCGFPRRGGAC